jgi:hypothetical protein
MYLVASLAVGVMAAWPIVRCGSQARAPLADVRAPLPVAVPPPAVVGADAAVVAVVAAAPDAAPESAEPAPRRKVVRERGPGWLTVDSRPYATIYVDGKKIGLTPVLRLELPAGGHRVRAVTQDGREQSFRVTIEPAKEAPRRRLVW